MEQELPEDESICTFCNKGLTEGAPLTDTLKGLTALVRVCKQKELDDLYK